MSDRQWKDKKPERSMSVGQTEEGQDVPRRVLPTALRPRSHTEYLGEEEKYLYEEKQQLVSFKNVAGYEEWVSGIVNQRPVASLKEAPFNWFRTVGEVAQTIYRTPKEALREGHFIPCYDPLGSGTYGDVLLGFYREDMNRRVPQRRAVALKRSTMRLERQAPTLSFITPRSISPVYQSAGSQQSGRTLSGSPVMQSTPLPGQGSPGAGPVFGTPSGFPSFESSFSPKAGPSGVMHSTPIGVQMPASGLHVGAGARMVYGPPSGTPIFAQSSQGSRTSSPVSEWSAFGSPRVMQSTPLGGHGSPKAAAFNPPSGMPSFGQSPIGPVSPRGAASASAVQYSPFSQLNCDKSVLIEMACLMALRHRNVVRLIDRYGIQLSQSMYLVLEYCDGGTLYNAVEESKDGRMQEELARYYFKQLVDGLAHINEMSIVHRDIKPANLLLQISPDGKDMILKIADFGISTVFEYKDSKGQLVELQGDARTGTVPYVPPEGLAWLYPPQCLLAAFAGPPTEIPTDPTDILHFGKQFAQQPAKYRKDLTAKDISPDYYKLPPLDVYAAGIVLYQMLTGIRNYPYNAWIWPDGLDLVFRGEAIRCKYLISDETFAFFKLLTNPDTHIRPPIQYVQNCHWMRKPAHRPSRIEPSKFQDFRKTTAFLNYSQFKSEGQEFLGLEHAHVVAAGHQSKSSSQGSSGSSSAGRGRSPKSRSRR